MRATACRLPAWILFLFAIAQPLAARDAYVILSGGGTPLSNNYSQYVQARALADFFRQRAPANSVWVFFGAGNRTGDPAVMGDTYHEIKRDGRLVDDWEPGFIPGNRPATKEAFFKALRDEILPAVRDGGTLFLFVGDHGEQTRDDRHESEMTLWQMQPNGRDAGWSLDRKEVLSLTDLRQALAAGIGRGKVVFCMTQCHSGGFHFLGVPRIPAAPAGWFTGTASSSPAGAAAISLPAAGFTATDELSLASGCAPDPDPDRWAGYERFIPESLLGTDLLSGVRRNPGLASFAQAHEAATVVDRTIDKPRSTSEQFLDTWANLIDTKLSSDPALKPKIKGQIGVFTAVLNGSDTGEESRAFREKWLQLQHFIAVLAAQNPDSAALLLKGTRKDLEAALRQPESRPGGGGGRRGSREQYQKMWKETLLSAWKKALLAGEITGLTPAVVEFEKKVLAQEEKGAAITVGDDDAILSLEYWESGLDSPETVNRADADAITLWAAERFSRIITWVRASSDPEVHAAAATWFAPRRRQPGGARPAGPAPVNRTAVERVLFYRRVLGAWAFLLATNDRSALAELQALQKLESTPLPAPIVQKKAGAES